MKNNRVRLWCKTVGIWLSYYTSIMLKNGAWQSLLQHPKNIPQFRILDKIVFFQFSSG